MIHAYYIYIYIYLSLSPAGPLSTSTLGPEKGTKTISHNRSKGKGDRVQREHGLTPAMWEFSGAHPVLKRFQWTMSSLLRLFCHHHQDSSMRFEAKQGGPLTKPPKHTENPQGRKVEPSNKVHANPRQPPPSSAPLRGLKALPPA